MKINVKHITLSIFSIILVWIAIAITIDSGKNTSKTYIPPTVFAHRGVRDSCVENSLEAFKRSKALGFNAIETDVRQTKDEKLIIFHDKSAKRLLHIDRNINSFEWEELKDQPLFHNGEPTPSKVILLKDFLKQFGHNTILYLDVKETTLSMADSLLSLLPANPKNIMIADHSIWFLLYLKYKNRNLQIILEGFDKEKEWLYYILPTSFKPDYYSSFLSKVDEEHMQFLKNNNLLNRRIVYGVNYKNMPKAYKLDLRNVILDYNTLIGNIKETEQRLGQ